MTLLAREYAAGSTGDSIPVLGLGTGQQVVLSSSASAASTAVGATTSVVTVWADVACYLAEGSAPTAGTTGFAVPANTLIDIKVTPGASKIAGRGVSGAGVLYIAERS